MNKNKIKNIALGVSLGLNILLGFFLGGGLISSCTAKKAENPASSVSNDANGQFIDGLRNRAPSARFAADEIDPNEYENLWVTSGANYSVHYQTVVYPSNQANVAVVGFSDTGICEFNRILTAGLYYVEVVRSASWGGGVWINQTAYDTIVTWGSTDNTYINYYDREEGYFYATQAMVDGGLYLAVSQANRNALLPKVYLIDGDYLPASDVVIFPREFFPWQIWGDRMSEVLINGPSVTSDTTAETQVVMFNNLLFRSGGKAYKGIWLSFKYAPGTKLGKYSSSGDIYTNGIVVGSRQNPPWYLSQMVYLPADGSNGDIALTANFSQVGEALLLMPNPVWAKDAYRRLEVLSYDNATMSNVPNAVGSNSPREWLNVLAQVEIVATTTAGDPFAMLGNGFSAVANILSIPILPFLTLGTLIFVPLIVLVILAILRLLAK